MKTLAKLPVTIVTGFLGAGKTTLLRHMLDNAEGRRIAVIVNEFGELGIDGEILKQCSIGCSEEEAQGRVFELANGCLCCTVQEEFFPVMRELVARRGDLDQILIETSGLALPKPLVQAFQWPEIRNACTVDAVITVVDSPAVAAGTFAAHPEQVDQQRRQDPNLDHESPLHELFEDQLASADLVILNKADQLDAEALARVRAEIAGELPAAVKIVEASRGELPLPVLLGLNAEAELHIDGRRPTTTTKATRTTTTTSSTPSTSISPRWRKLRCSRPSASWWSVTTYFASRVSPPFRASPCACWYRASASASTGISTASGWPTKSAAPGWW